MLKKILLVGLIFFIFLGAPSMQTQFKMSIPSYEVSRGQAKIDVMMKDAPQIGALQFNIIYNPKILQFVNVSAGKLTSTAMITENIDNKIGITTIGIISLNGFSGEGSVATLYANISGSEGASSELTLLMENKAFITDTKNKELALPLLENGRIKVGGNILSSSLMIWIIIGIIFIATVVLVFILIEKRKESKTLQKNLKPKIKK